MRLELAQLDPELLEQAAPEVKNAQKLERRAEAANAVFDMCVLHALFELGASDCQSNTRTVVNISAIVYFFIRYKVVSWTCRLRRRG